MWCQSMRFRCSTLARGIVVSWRVAQLIFEWQTRSRASSVQTIKASSVNIILFRCWSSSFNLLVFILYSCYENSMGLFAPILDGLNNGIACVFFLFETAKIWSSRKIIVIRAKNAHSCNAKRKQIRLLFFFSFLFCLTNIFPHLTVEMRRRRRHPLPEFN